MSEEAKITVAPKDAGVLLRRAQAGWRSAVRRALQRSGREAANMLRHRTAAVGAVDLGKVKRGWSWRIGPDLSVDVYNKEPHAVFVERGRRPGAKPPPVAAILPWVRRHLNSGPTAKSTAYAVAQSISRKGIRARPIVTDPAMRRKIGDLFAKNVGRAIREASAGRDE